MSGPVALRPAFRTYTLLTRRLDSNQALDMVRRDLADPVSDRIIEVLILSFEQGAAVTLDVLEELSQSVTEDLRLNETIRTMMMDVKIDAAAIGIIPFALLLATLAILEEWRSFYRSAGGQLVLSAVHGVDRDRCQHHSVLHPGPAGTADPRARGGGRMNLPAARSPRPSERPS